MQATAEQLDRKIVELGARLDDGVGDKLKRDFVRYMEDCELEDLETDDLRSENAVSRAGNGHL